MSSQAAHARRSQQWDTRCPLLGNKCTSIFNYPCFSYPAAARCFDVSLRTHWSNLIKNRQCWKTKTKSNCPLALPCASFFHNPPCTKLECTACRSFQIEGLSLAHFNYTSFPGISALLKEWHPQHRRFCHEKRWPDLLPGSSLWICRVNFRSLQVCSKSHTDVRCVNGLIDRC